MNISDIKFSGIADEAGKSLATQIRAHRELGWKYIEIRNVDGEQLTDLPDDKFETIVAQLADADLQVSAFASGIANWATKITDDFHLSVHTLERAIKRMQRLNTKYIRVMSYPNDGLSDDAWRDEAVRRMKEMGARAEAAGVILMVENCDGWASTSPQNYARFFELVNSPAVQAVYDTGNPASHGHSNTWEWYNRAKPHIGYIHIKAHTLDKTAKKASTPGLMLAKAASLKPCAIS
jgi:sugar phosphate isomerase/epimerase